MSDSELNQKYQQVIKENEDLKKEIEILREQLNLSGRLNNRSEILTQMSFNIQTTDSLDITKHSSSDEKLELYLSLFRGRNDVCAKRWKNKPGYSPFCFDDFKLGVCQKPKIKCQDCKNQRFAPYDKEQLKRHLMGEHVLGLYPLTKNDTCFLLAIDFDENSWQEDVSVIRRLCNSKNIPIYAERSRSGKGCHLWLFFDGEIKASLARKFGMSILDLSMQVGENLKFTSYDRLFPSQDLLQKDGFGNLIALPLQKEARPSHNTVFIDEQFIEIEDQWQYLSKVEKISVNFVERFCEKNAVLHENAEISTAGSEITSYKIDKSDFPENVLLKKEKGIVIDKNGISSKGIYFLRKISSYFNPEFYSKQSMRQSTFGVPRITVMFEEDEKSIRIPRGLLKKLIDNLDHSGVKYSIAEERSFGTQINVEFRGSLSIDQQVAFDRINSFEDGVLSALPGFGKTVVGAKLISSKKRSTLILVHTKELAYQWLERLEQFLEINEPNIDGMRRNSAIGLLGGGKNNLGGKIDIVIMQSMFDTDRDIKQLPNQYGLVIVDECHHVSAVHFSRIMGSLNSRFIYGLTATPFRKDGHHPIIFMLCGPIRYKSDSNSISNYMSFERTIVPRFTSIRMPITSSEKGWSITDIYKHICESKLRNEMIVNDIEKIVIEGKYPIVLTERISQVNLLLKNMLERNLDVVVLTGKLTAKVRKTALEKLHSKSNSGRHVLLATGKLIGEGFDLPNLDTLFLAMPIAWKGTITQYAGRLNRDFEGKKEVKIYDYIDVNIPVLERMYYKRLAAYRSVGYTIKANASEETLGSVILDEASYYRPLLDDIQKAKKSIQISSPNIQDRKLKLFKNYLSEKVSEGVRVTICIKNIEEYQENQKENYRNFIKELEEIGIVILQVSQISMKFLIVDCEVVWLGNINILGNNFKDASIIRLKSDEVANVLTGSFVVNSE